jgi:ribosomal protein S18 acetylase RimI-like enzyme
VLPHTGKVSAGRRDDLLNGIEAMRTLERTIDAKATARPALNLDLVEIGALSATERDLALGVLARGMRDNPVHVRAFGSDPAVREQRLAAMFGASFTVMSLHEQMLVARDDRGTILAVCQMTPPDTLPPTQLQQLHLMPRMMAMGPGAAFLTVRWLKAWTDRDPGKPHWHLGPLAVDAGLQGRGIGSRLMKVVCARLDAARDIAWLETDKPENVRFYEKFGFTVAAETEILGLPNWFMIRRPSRHS